MAEGGDGIVDSGVGAIEAALQQVVSFDVDELSNQQLGAAVLRTEQLLNAVHALSALLLERFEQDGGWAADGALSAAAWTAQRTGSARAGLRSRRRQGAALTRLPAVGAEARTGRLSTEHLRAIGDCVRRHPDLAARPRGVLAAAGRDAERGGLPARRPPLAGGGRRRRAAPTAASPGQASPTRSAACTSPARSRACLRVDGLFTPGDADLVEAALGAGVDQALRAARDGDPSVTGRPVSALRAGVLVDLLAQTMRQEPSDASAPDRYRVAVVVQHGQPTVPGGRRLRRRRLPGRARRAGRGPRRRPPDQPVARRHPPGDHHPRPRLCIPRLRPAAVMDRHPSLHPMERRRHHVSRQWRAPLPTPPHVHPPTPTGASRSTTTNRHPNTRRHAVHHPRWQPEALAS